MNYKHLPNKIMIKYYSNVLLVDFDIAQNMLTEIYNKPVARHNKQIRMSDECKELCKCIEINKYAITVKDTMDTHKNIHFIENVKNMYFTEKTITFEFDNSLLTFNGTYFKENEKNGGTVYSNKCMFLQILNHKNALVWNEKLVVKKINCQFLINKIIKKDNYFVISNVTNDRNVFVGKEAINFNCLHIDLGCSSLMVDTKLVFLINKDGNVTKYNRYSNDKINSFIRSLQEYGIDKMLNNYIKTKLLN